MAEASVKCAIAGWDGTTLRGANIIGERRRRARTAAAAEGKLHATAGCFRGAMALAGDRGMGRYRGGSTAVVPVAQRDVRKAPALDPAERCAIERHRAKDDGGFPRIGLR